MTIYRVVNTDNFGHDYPDESFVGPEFEKVEEAEAFAETKNVYDNQSRYFKVVEMPYELQPGFEP